MVVLPGAAAAAGSNRSSAAPFAHIPSLPLPLPLVLPCPSHACSLITLIDAWMCRKFEQYNKYKKDLLYIPSSSPGYTRKVSWYIYYFWHFLCSQTTSIHLKFKVWKACTMDIGYYLPIVNNQTTVESVITSHNFCFQWQGTTLYSRFSFSLIFLLEKLYLVYYIIYQVLRNF